MKKYFLVAILIMASLITLPSICVAAGPGAGSMTKQNVRIGNCTAESLTVKWNLSSLMGEPTVSGSYQWVGNNNCELPSSTTIWLQVVSGSGRGYVDLRPVTPKANSGFGYNTTGSPNWNGALCNYNQTKAQGCLDENSAKALWKAGKVNDFSVAWDGVTESGISAAPRNVSQQRQVNQVSHGNYPNQDALISALTEFYNKRGEWAGTFRVGHVDKIRPQPISDTRLLVHVRYFYIPVAGNPQGRADSGYDQRTFVFNKVGSDWLVAEMGGYMSAQF